MPATCLRSRLGRRADRASPCRRPSVARDTVRDVVTGLNRCQWSDRLCRVGGVKVFALSGENSAHETTSGCCLSSARRWRSVMPPQTPNSTRLSSESAAHSAMTGQCRQITAALLCAAPLTKSSSGSVERHRALDTHARRPSAAHLMNSAIGRSSYRGRELTRVVNYSNPPRARMRCGALATSQLVA